MALQNNGRRRVERDLEGEESSLSLRDLLTIVFRYKWLIITLFLLVSVAGTAVLWMLPHVYESHAALLFRIARTNLSFDPGAETLVKSTMEREEDVARDALSIMKGEVLAEKVVDDLGVDYMRTKLASGRLPLASDPNEEATREEIRMNLIRYVQNNLRTEMKRSIVELAFQATDPELAQTVLSSLVHQYVDLHMNVFTSTMSREMFEEEIRTVQEELEVKRAELQALKSEHEIIAADTERDALTAQVSGLLESLNQARGTVAQLQAKITALEEAIAARPASIEMARTEEANPVVTDIEQQLLALRIERQDAVAKYQESNPNVKLIDEKIKVLREQLANEPAANVQVTTGADEIRLEMQRELEFQRADLNAAQANEQKLTEMLASAKQELARVSGLAERAGRLDKEIEQLENNYAQYRDSMQRAKISAALDRDRVGNVSVVQEATRPLEPVGPRKRRNLALVLCVALFGSFAAAFGLNYFDDTVKTPGDMEAKLELPVLATVSESDYASCQ